MRDEHGAGRRPKVEIIVLLGVSGSGKTTVGKLLADKLVVDFYEGDDYHPKANKEKMRAGIALTDEDRQPWLAAIRDLISDLLARHACAVIACSALKQSYRDYIKHSGVQFVYLKGEPNVLRERLERRKGHFFNPALLASQLETLEEPPNALVVNISRSPDEIVKEIVDRLALARRPRRDH